MSNMHPQHIIIQKKTLNGTHRMFQTLKEEPLWGITGKTAVLVLRTTG